MIRLTDEDPCIGCADKVDDDYGRFCDIACGKHSTYIIKQEAYKAQLIKNADAIDSMTADGWYLEDIVKAMREEAG